MRSSSSMKVSHMRDLLKRTQWFSAYRDIFLILTLSLLISCSPEPTNDETTADESAAGESAAGESAAGESTAGEFAAGSAASAAANTGAPARVAAG